MTTSEGELLGQTSLQQLLAGLPTALPVQGDLCSVPRTGRRAPCSRPVWGWVVACRLATGGPTGFSGALCAGGAVFTDGLLRNTRRLTHKRPVPRALWEVNVGLS